jgi:hypothetical protein
MSPATAMIEVNTAKGLLPSTCPKETTMRCLPVTAFVVVALLMHADVRGQESNAPPEMKVLERLLGTWKVEQITRVPEETRSTNTVKRELVLGGRFVQEMGGFDNEGKPTHMGMYTYDSNRKSYRYWFFLSGGFYTESTGSWDESRQTLTFTNTLPGGATGVITLRFSDETTFVFSIISKDAGGEVGYHLEGKGVRQKVEPEVKRPTTKSIDVTHLPKLEDYLPPLDEGRIEIAAPKGWHPMSRREGFVARFARNGASGAVPPRILVTCDPAPGDSPTSLTAADVEQFETYIAPILEEQLRGRRDVREQPVTLIIGDRAWKRYVVAASFKGMAVDRMILKTVANGRIYTIDLQVFHQPDRVEYRDEAYAIAGGMRYLNDTNTGNSTATEKQVPIH